MARAALLLHGFTGTPACFAPFAEALGPHWTCCCPTLPGHGPAPGLLPQRSFRQAVADFFQVLRRCFDPRWSELHLVGYSLGARIALGLVEQHPTHFASATLIGAHPGLKSDEERAARISSDARWCDLILDGGLQRFCDAWEAQPIFASQQRLPDATRRAQRLNRTSHTAEGLAWSLNTFGLGRMPTYHRLLQAPPLPVHWIVGELDTKFRTVAEEMATANPRLGVTILPDGGHNLVLEQPLTLAKAFVEGATNDRHHLERRARI